MAIQEGWLVSKTLATLKHSAVAREVVPLIPKGMSPACKLEAPQSHPRVGRAPASTHDTHLLYDLHFQPRTQLMWYQKEPCASCHHVALGMYVPALLHPGLRPQVKTAC